MRRSLDPDDVGDTFADRDHRNPKEEMNRSERDEYGTRMARMYERTDDGRQATELVRCPTCGVLIEWPKRHQLPVCYHTRQQRVFSSRGVAWGRDVFVPVDELEDDEAEAREV